MYLWLNLLQRKSRRIVSDDPRFYSDGRIEEFVWTKEMEYGFRGRSNIESFDLDGSPVSLQHGARCLLQSAADLKRRGFPTPAHDKALWRIWRIYSHYTSPDYDEPDYFPGLGRDDKRHEDYSLQPELEEALRAYGMEHHNPLKDIPFLRSEPLPEQVSFGVVTNGRIEHLP